MVLPDAWTRILAGVRFRNTNEHGRHVYGQNVRGMQAMGPKHLSQFENIENNNAFMQGSQWSYAFLRASQ